ncbi:hypothetical protein V8E52_003240 [Russula decolorans]
MVAWLHGPLILKNRYLVDTSGFIVEFDAAPGEQFLLFGDIISMVLLPTAPPREMQQKPLVVLSGTVSSAVSTSLTKVFFIHVYQELINFLEWDYLRVSDHTKITICAAINLRRFNGNTNTPARTHVLIRGYFDDYDLDLETKHLMFLKIIVESLEIQCGPNVSGQVHRCSTLLSTPSTSSSLEEDGLGSGYDINEVDTSLPFPPSIRRAPLTLTPNGPRRPDAAAIALSSSTPSESDAASPLKPSKRTCTE